MKDTISISKRKLWQYVNKKINRFTHHYHVLSIITILFEEMLVDLKRGKEIRIHNFGTLELKQLKPRNHFDVIKQKVVLAEPHKIIRFTLAPLIKKKLVAHLDKILQEIT